MNVEENSSIRLKTFIEKCGGLIPAAFQLNVRPSTLAKVLAGRPLSAITRAKLKTVLGEGSAPNTVSQDEFEIIVSRIRGSVKNKVDIIREAGKLGVNPSTIEKILEGRSVSFGVQKKILAALEKKQDNPSTTSPLVERLKKIYGLYQEEGTLEAVGKKIGLTRERVRQLLAKGSKLGLFDYKPFDYPFVSKEKLLADYRDYLSLVRVAKANRISLPYLHKLLTAYGIGETDLHLVWLAGHKIRCADAYNRVKEQLGHHPTTTELQRSKSWRYLSIKITRLWGSVDAFREELSIPKPPKGSRSFSEDTRRWREERQRVALIVRMQHLDRIRECLNISGPMSATEIAWECGLAGQRTLALLKLLMSSGEVIREGSLASTKYQLAKH